MAIFEYKGRDASAEVIEAYQLARVSQVNAFGGISLLVDNPLGAALGGSDYDTNFNLPTGWRELTPAELGLDPALLDKYGVWSSPTSSSAQIKITGKVENGEITHLSLAFAGTSDFGDIAAYFDLEDQRILNDFTVLLDAAANFAQASGLTGADVTVTGYSLGGAITNAMAFRADEVADGFFAESSYFGFASPIVHDDPDRILNFGMENDVVYRSVGDVDASLAQGLFEAAINDDKMFASSTDNIVLFEDVYANPLFPIGFFSLLNLTNGWAAHVRGVFETPWTTIAQSTFYEDIETDSAIVIAALSPILRPFTWVADVSRITSDHYGQDAFILGTNASDKLRDNVGSDALDGFGGNDEFDLSLGNDRVAGGAGSDRVYLDGSASDYTAIMLGDGTLYLDSGAHGLKEMTGVEKVTFTGPLIDQTFDVLSSRLDSQTWFTSDKSYASRTEGSTGADNMWGGSGNDRLFGRDGVDQIMGQGGADLLVGGTGADTLNGGTDDDRLFGGSGNDLLVAGSGNDRLSGDAGHDTFDFSAGLSGNDTITDFDSGAWDGDVLVFGAQTFASASAALDAMWMWGRDTYLSTSSGSLRLEDVHISEMGLDDIVIV
ncbi:MAG: calcium-binding protein [Pseudomonadota bacterium]